MIKRSWKTLAAGLVLFGGVSGSQALLAGDVFTAGGDMQKCEKLFASPESDMTVQLASMSCLEQSCCAPADCCAPVDCGECGCGEGCGLYDDCEESLVNFGGWLQLGYHNNVVPLARRRNDPDIGSFNDHPHRLNVHQAWLYAEKEADGSEGIDWGFRMDVMYGVDASDTSAFGNPDGSWDNGGRFQRGAGYGWAIPQLYATLAAGDWSFKAGHFFTLVGYEVVTAPDNFFYSHALTMFNSEPFTHTGAIATYSATENTSLYGGWTAGWDTGFDQVNGGSTFLGGFSTSLTEKSTLSYITTIGNFGKRGGGQDGYSHSLVMDTAVTEKLNWVIQSDMVHIGTDRDFGINNYLIQKITDKISTGVRAEWWRNDGRSQYAATYGINIKPTDNLIFRPEIRYDWKDPNRGAETTFGIDGILTF
ncbi:MAG: outer membrane beta-barrel protein [Planctomycetaceae bacterium]